MAFDSVTIGLSKNGDTPVATWRQDAAAGNSIVGSLSSAVGVNTYSWKLVGRPEGSTAGGTGPEPIALGTATTCAFTVDIPGTYILSCLLNGGAPDATIITAGIAILETITTGDGRSLRLLGPGETSQDISDPLVAQDWIKELNRWLRYLSAVSGGGGSDHLVLVQTGATPGTLAALITSADGSVIATVTGTAPNLRLDLSANAGGNPFGLYYVVGGSHSDPPTGLTRQAPAGGDYFAAALTSSYVNILSASTPEKDPGLLIWPAGAYRLRLRCYATAASHVQFIVFTASLGYVATSAPVAIPADSSYATFDIYAVTTADTPVSNTTDAMYLTVQAKADVGTATLTIGDGWSVNNTTLSVPFCGNHAYTHKTDGGDPLPAASTTVAGLVQLSSATPQSNGTATPGTTGQASDAGHVHQSEGGDLLSPVAGGDFFLKGSGVGDDDWDLLRAPTGTDTSTVAITSGGGAGVLFNGPALQYGDPGLAVWSAGNAIVDFWLNVDSHSASFFVSIGRTLHDDGSPTWIVTDQPLGIIASTVPILVQVVFDFPQSAGSIDDGLVIKVTATTATSCTATLGTGGTNQSKINLPLPPAAAPALRMSNQTVFLNGNAAPDAAGQVLTSTSDNPVQAAWAAPAAATALQTATTTVVVVSGAVAPTAGQVLTATSPSVGAWQTPSYVPTLDDYLPLYEDFVDSNNLHWPWLNWASDGASGNRVAAYIQSPQIGVMALSTGSSASGLSQISHNQSFGINLTPGDGWNCFSDIMIPVLSNGTDSFHVRMGFVLNTGSFGGTNWQLYVEYNHAVNSGKWTMYLYDSSLQTLIASPAPAVTANTWYRIQIQQVKVGSYSQFHLIINGVDQGYLQTSTTMTEMIFYPIWISKAAGNTSCVVNIDQTRLWTQGHPARCP